MNNKNIAFFFQSILALLLAVQVWVWLRYAGAFWLSDSLGFLKYLVKSVDPLKISLNAFLILVVSVLAGCSQNGSEGCEYKGQRAGA